MENIKNFINHLKIEKNYSEHTLNAYESDLNQFINFINKNDVESITKQDILSFLSDLREKGISATTSNRKLAAIKSFFKYLMVEGIIGINPAQIIESAKTPKKLPRIVTPEEYDEIMGVIDNNEDRALIELLYATGVRREEVVSLKKTDLDYTTGVLKVLGKNEKERLIPIAFSVIPNVSIWISQTDSEWVFPSKVKKGEPNTPRWVNKIVNKWSDKAGLTGITPHSFRHAFGTYLYENGADIKSIQDMMGHESADTTDIYVQSSVGRNRKEFFKAHPLMKKRPR